jgi:alkylation response protein AidB-like acyl-CoA dehydrogenase
MSTTSQSTENNHILSEDVLEACYRRAPQYDLENRFFDEDYEQLQAAGYLKMAVPKELGGMGMNVAEVCREQRRLAYYAPATAIAVNMHLYWTGVAAEMYRFGDKSLEWLLKEAAAGKVFAAGHAESGTDVPLFYSSTDAKRVEGGWIINGHKNFGSLTPVWDYLGIHAMDSSDPANRKVIHGFVPRDSKGITIQENWDTLGMRATRSDDTIMKDVFLPDALVGAVVPTGLAGANLFVFAIFVWAELTFGSVYLGLAQRAYDLVVERSKNKTSVSLPRGMAHHPGVQQLIAEMFIDLDVAGCYLDKLAADWTGGVDHGAMWAARLVTAKYTAAEAAWRVVDKALEVSGGFGIFRKAGLERLFRDARLGRIHPANRFLTHEFVAKSVLGLNFDEQPRWG